MNEVLVIGHRNPDLDSICSAIGYAEFKRRTGLPEAVAARCGDTNERIDFVLRRFGVSPPRFVANVAPKVRDVMQRNVMSALPDTPVAEALAWMDRNNLRVLPVLDDTLRCLGLASVFKMMQFHLPGADRLFESRRVLASLHGVARTLSARVVHATEPEREEDLTLMIGGMSLESFRERLSQYEPRKILIVVGDRHEVQQLAVESGVRCIVVTGNLTIRRETIEAAERNGVSLLLSPHDSMTTAMLCRAAITVSHMIDEDFLSFRDDELLASARRKAMEAYSHAFPVLDEAGTTIGILSKSDFLKKVDRRLILVDHNELSQAVQGAEEAEIIEIIDHHRIGALSTTQPIYFLNDPVGSTSTIVADCFLRQGVAMPKEIAGLLLAGLISDTLNLTSPTATPRDGSVLKQLEVLAGINATQFAEDLFRSGSILVSRPAPQAITSDCKEYVEDEQRFSVAQIEEIGFTQFWRCKDEVMEALRAYRERQGYFFSALLVTDVTRRNSLLLLAAGEELMDTIDYPEVEPGIFELAEVVSRKKQLLPFLAHCLHQIR
jgi:manganese-dependent inorganic pyrophosphatase